MRPAFARQLMLVAAIVALMAGLGFGLLPGRHDPLLRALLGVCWIATGLIWLRRWRGRPR